MLIILAYFLSWTTPYANSAGIPVKHYESLIDSIKTNSDTKILSEQIENLYLTTFLNNGSSVNTKENSRVGFCDSKFQLDLQKAFEQKSTLFPSLKIKLNEAINQAVEQMTDPLQDQEKRELSSLGRMDRSFFNYMLKNNLKYLLLGEKHGKVWSGTVPCNWAPKARLNDQDFCSVDQGNEVVFAQADPCKPLSSYGQVFESRLGLFSIRAARLPDEFWLPLLDDSFQIRKKIKELSPEDTQFLNRFLKLAQDCKKELPYEAICEDSTLESFLVFGPGTYVGDLRMASSMRQRIDWDFFGGWKKSCDHKRLNSKKAIKEHILVSDYFVKQMHTSGAETFIVTSEHSNLTCYERTRKISGTPFGNACKRESITERVYILEALEGDPQVTLSASEIAEWFRISKNCCSESNPFSATLPILFDASCGGVTRAAKLMEHLLDMQRHQNELEMACFYAISSNEIQMASASDYGNEAQSQMREWLVNSQDLENKLKAKDPNLTATFFSGENGLIEALTTSYQKKNSVLTRLASNIKVEPIFSKALTEFQTAYPKTHFEFKVIEQQNSLSEKILLLVRKSDRAVKIVSPLSTLDDIQLRRWFSEETFLDRCIQDEKLSYGCQIYEDKGSLVIHDYCDSYYDLYSNTGPLCVTNDQVLGWITNTDQKRVLLTVDYKSEEFQFNSSNLPISKLKFPVELESSIQQGLDRRLKVINYIDDGKLYQIDLNQKESVAKSTQVALLGPEFNDATVRKSDKWTLLIKDHKLWIFDLNTNAPLVAGQSIPKSLSMAIKANEFITDFSSSLGLQLKYVDNGQIITLTPSTKNDVRESIENRW